MARPVAVSRHFPFNRHVQKQEQDEQDEQPKGDAETHLGRTTRHGSAALGKPWCGRFGRSSPWAPRCCSSSWGSHRGCRTPPPPPPLRLSLSLPLKNIPLSGHPKATPVIGRTGRLCGELGPYWVAIDHKIGERATIKISSVITPSNLASVKDALLQNECVNQGFRRAWPPLDGIPIVSGIAETWGIVVSQRGVSFLR